MAEKLWCKSCGFRSDTNLWSEGKKCPDCGEAKMEVE